MRILFDHQVFSWQQYGGISRYFAAQISGLPTFGHEALLPAGFFSENAYLRDMPGFARPSLAPFSFKGKKIIQNLLGRPASRRAIRQYRPEVFHPTYFDPYFLETTRRYNIPFVVTVHDMIHELYRHGGGGFLSLDAGVSEHKKLLCEKAAAVIAVSENTRQDLLRLYPWLDAGKVKVIYHGNSMTPPEMPLTRLGEEPYLLYVGQRKGYKNFAWMVETLAPLLRARKPLALYCAGGGPFDTGEMALFEQLGIADQVKMKSAGTDAALAVLYQHAACFIFPSSYEGFGIPVLEAFACGCPVILNRSSSLPEVGGDAALYFEAHNPEDLTRQLSLVLDNQDLRNNMIALGQQRVQAFSWKKSVAAHADLYASLIK